MVRCGEITRRGQTEDLDMSATHARQLPATPILMKNWTVAFRRLWIVAGISAVVLLLVGALAHQSFGRSTPTKPFNIFGGDEPETSAPAEHRGTEDSRVPLSPENLQGPVRDCPSLVFLDVDPGIDAGRPAAWISDATHSATLVAVGEHFDSYVLVRARAAMSGRSAEVWLADTNGLCRATAHPGLSRIVAPPVAKPTSPLDARSAPPSATARPYLKEEMSSSTKLHNLEQPRGSFQSK